MVEKKKIIAIVQARGGSRGLPRKNIKPLKGVPLVAYSICAGLQSKLVDRVILSTDDHEIAEIGRQWGAEVPFMRPAKYAKDDSPDLPLFLHALSWLKKHEDYEPDFVVQLRPTSPIRPPDLIDKAIRIMLSNPNAHSVRGVVPSGQNPHKMWRIIDENHPMENLLNVDGINEPYNSPRQKLPQTYWQTGHIDVIRSSVILKRSMSGKNIFPLILDPKYSIDIDTQESLDYAEWLMEHLDLPFVRPKLLTKKRF